MLDFYLNHPEEQQQSSEASVSYARTRSRAHTPWHRRTRWCSRPMLQVVTPPPPSCRFKHNNLRRRSFPGHAGRLLPGSASLLRPQVSSFHASVFPLSRLRVQLEPRNAAVSPGCRYRAQPGPAGAAGLPVRPESVLPCCQLEAVPGSARPAEAASPSLFSREVC